MWFFHAAILDVVGNPSILDIHASVHVLSCPILGSVLRQAQFWIGFLLSDTMTFLLLLNYAFFPLKDDRPSCDWDSRPKHSI